MNIQEAISNVLTLTQQAEVPAPLGKEWSRDDLRNLTRYVDTIIPNPSAAHAEFRQYVSTAPNKEAIVDRMASDTAVLDAEAKHRAIEEAKGSKPQSRYARVLHVAEYVASRRLRQAEVEAARRFGFIS